jgi:hypothetical protein
MTVIRIVSRILSTKPIRRMADTGLKIYSRYRSVTMDNQSAGEMQLATLRNLVRRAQRTQFGRDHDFSGIHTIADYQERVPLRDYESFWQTYLQPNFRNLRNVVWPGDIPYLALSSGTTAGTTKYIPVSREMLRSNRRAAMTALAWFRTAHPSVPILTGQTFFLGGSTDLQAAEYQTGGRDWRSSAKSAAPLMGDLSGIAAKEISSLCRPYTFPPLDLALLTDWETKLQLLAKRSASLPITAITGVPSWLLVFFEQLRQVTGRNTVAEIWPELRLVIHGGTAFEPYRSLFHDIIGSDEVRYLEVYPASEGFVAAEDPRFGRLRLITDHGIFFEFVPVDELKSSSPVRQTVTEVVPGIQYAVVLTTCAGLWSYVLGDTVCFESRDPPLLRFTGRIRQSLSAFGEHLIGEEIDRAVAAAADCTGAAVSDFHVGPLFPETTAAAGRHRFFVEFVKPPHDVCAFAQSIDQSLLLANEDYRAHRQRDLTLLPPDIVAVPRGGFAQWMHSRGKLGGQHKVPRIDNSGNITSDLSRRFCAERQYDMSRNG